MTTDIKMWETVRDDMRATLRGAQEERDLRPDLVDTPTGVECEWAVYERSVMLGRVNRWRKMAGLPLANAELVARVERQASGHSDYTAKFALYCAEIALGEGDWTR